MLTLLIVHCGSILTKYFYESTNGNISAGIYEFHLYGGTGGDAYSDGILQSNHGGRGSYIKYRFRVEHSESYEIIIGGNGHSGPVGVNHFGLPNGGNSGNSPSNLNGVGSGAGSTILKLGGQVVAVAAGGGGAAMNFGGSPGGGIGYNYRYVNNTWIKNFDSMYFLDTGFGGNGTDSTCYPGSGGGGGYKGGIGGNGTCITPYYNILSTSGTSFVNENYRLYLSSFVVDGLHSYKGDNMMIYSLCGNKCTSCNTSLKSLDTFVGFKIADYDCSCFPYKPLLDMPKSGSRSLLQTYNGFICNVSCPVHFYQINTTCFSCTSNCDYCDDNFTCLKCSYPFIRKGYECVDTCGEGYYVTYVDENRNGNLLYEKRCERCSPYCIECDDSKTCKSCKEGHKLIDGYCTEECEAGYYEENGECKKCPKGCLICESDKKCLECDQKLVLGAYQDANVCYPTKNSQFKRKLSFSITVTLTLCK
ncbi:hypothetical protein TVAG_082170 [Trichomonas vaginalis G3]|uniref:receptor protein-tyrosine kinase n=1 Tax=Trichomonas vaginalis (strain ATCC PRA-98 / G3) TaxID=412133 RepID=A2FM43_TRIV3|nr:serine-type endopeptidase protein [Trichomonas vaginalis G3]EAX94010.1 hypothetical protein TVAG_082170 [Trichomonas vaginalis G3]KAI5508146.1 serine-type endopeptidase protein [Trichomonas vaginalis G3]|eukprot:XP_001306940.1 hypothetical protein [Trichomonas vaginalis G3]